MPIYEFRCEQCLAVFEHLAMSSGDNAELKCPGCGGRELVKLMSSCSANVITTTTDSGGGSVETKNCAGSGSCGTLTLPGYTR